MRRLIFMSAFLISVFDVKFVEAKLVSCSQGYLRCADNSQCVSDEQICDYKKDCPDFSDERFALCKEIKSIQSHCRAGQIYIVNQCSYISTACNEVPSDYEQQYRVVCSYIKFGLKPSEEIDSIYKEKSRLEELFTHLASSYNESNWARNDSACPPLYMNIGGKCMALFTAAPITWAEAKQFCKSISGTLAIIRKMKDYEALLKYLKNNELTTNFWIGGLYQSKPSNMSSWEWLDEKEIVMGSPFWSLYHTFDCTMRETSSVCYQYSLSPRENKDGFCLAMDYEFYYYFSDRNCFEKRNPLCFLNEKAKGIHILQLDEQNAD